MTTSAAIDKFFSDVDMLNRSRVLVTVDDTNDAHDRFIPADRVWDGEREVASEHAVGATRGWCAHDKGEENSVRVCYTCRTEDW